MKPRCRGEGRLAPGLQVCGLRVDYTSLRGRFPPRIRAGRLRCRSTSRNRRGGRVTTSRCEWVPVSCGKWASHVESDAAAFGNFVDYAWTTARSWRAAATTTPEGNADSGGQPTRPEPETTRPGWTEGATTRQGRGPATGNHSTVQRVAADANGTQHNAPATTMGNGGAMPSRGRQAG